jgi:membrane carboxypeptidase/penicillin-binding protein PbpC
MWNMKTLAKLWREVWSASSMALAELESAPGPKPTFQMCRFLILGEDQRIELHMGVDPIALMRSIWMTCVRRRRQGGSTIAMQLVRTVTRRYERTIWRKITEIILAVRLTYAFDRRDIARIYLWVAYYGWNMHGFQQAYEGISKATGVDSKIGAANLVARLKYPQPRNLDERQLGRISQRVHHLLALDSGFTKRGTFSGIANHGTISNS